MACLLKSIGLPPLIGVGHEAGQNGAHEEESPYQSDSEGEVSCIARKADQNGNDAAAENETKGYGEGHGHVSKGRGHNKGESGETGREKGDGQKRLKHNDSD